jgi:hypothetical protein
MQQQSPWMVKDITPLSAAASAAVRCNLQLASQLQVQPLLLLLLLLLQNRLLREACKLCGTTS